MSVSIVFDATHKNISALPNGSLAALYTTGSPDIKATANDFAAHPNCVRICQDNGSDPTADIIDMETGAATPADAVRFITNARASFNANTRPGQRWPGIYAQASRVTEMANALVTAHDTNVPLWVAHWGVKQSDATSQVALNQQPFPVIAMQFANLGRDDISVFSNEWLNRRSGIVAPIVPVMPPGQWKNPKEWEWKNVVIVGVGEDDRIHIFAFNPGTGLWLKVA